LNVEGGVGGQPVPRSSGSSLSSSVSSASFHPLTLLCVSLFPCPSCSLSLVYLPVGELSATVTFANKPCSLGPVPCNSHARICASPALSFSFSHWLSARWLPLLMAAARGPLSRGVRVTCQGHSRGIRDTLAVGVRRNSLLAKPNTLNTKP